MTKWLVLAALVAASFAPAAGSAAGFCTAQWAPVCALKAGAQKTYSNAGCAKADGAEVVREGQCGEADPQPTKAPVCALKDGAEKTYSNVGCAKADSAEVVREGQCGDPTPEPTKTPIFCTENYDPVCGSKDGAQKTYSNACFAHADDAKVVADGECANP